MSLPNVSSLYQRIAKGSEGGYEFARIINQLLIADSKERNYIAETYSDASGDYKGVDCILKHPLRYSTNYGYSGVQYKFYPSPLSAKHRLDIKESLKKAIKCFPQMGYWIIVTPEDFQKSDMEWFDELRKEHEFKLNFFEQAKRIKIDQNEIQAPPFLKIYHYGHSMLMSLFIQHPDIAKFYYPEFYIGEIGNLVLSHTSIDSVNTNWSKTDDPYYLVQEGLKKGELKSSELVFDFLFANNTANIDHLHQINIVIENVWTEIKGLNSDEIIKSIGTISVDLDFTKQINTVDLNVTEGGYLVFYPNKSRRFMIQLNRFAKNCPGNMAKLHFEFLFDNQTIQTHTYTLDF